MNLIVFTRHGGSRHFDLSHPRAWGALVLGLGLFGAALFSGGYYLAAWQAQAQVAADPVRVELAAQAAEIAHTKRTAQADVDALSAKVGELQAHVMRLDALGGQLTSMAGLKRGEFDFNAPPAEGGPEVPGSAQHTGVPDFLASLDQLSAQVKDREQQLAVLENLLMSRNVQQAAEPAGAPVAGGYVSSVFGMRIDPFTGELAMHSGMDFAGSEGEAVEAVAAGVVTWAGPRAGYGNLVEIDHGNGYATRYGHNETILVQVGDVVKKGAHIALMGSTGRSTGPHVHFEVLYNGTPINPARFVKAAGVTQVAARPQSQD
jgi:murein DD-endopeptidase MepM/ murein hydrolase activator NlpD